MTPSVNERARAIATFRHISVRLMEMLARWTPTTPEMEAKVMFGRHIWDYAQMANALGERTFELRQAKHYTLRPVDAYEVLMDKVCEASSTGERLDMLYEGLLPGLVERYRRYATITDPILDEPTVVIVERIVRELERQRVEVNALKEELGVSAKTGDAIAANERLITNVVSEQVAA